MAAHAARRLLRMTTNLSHILGIELLCAAQGVEFRSPLTTSPLLQGVITTLRQHVPSLTSDRYMADDIAIAAKLVDQGIILNSAQHPSLQQLM